MAAFGSHTVWRGGRFCGLDCARGIALMLDGEYIFSAPYAPRSSTLAQAADSPAGESLRVPPECAQAHSSTSPK